MEPMKLSLINILVCVDGACEGDTEKNKTVGDRDMASKDANQNNPQNGDKSGLICVIFNLLVLFWSHFDEIFLYLLISDLLPIE